MIDVFHRVGASREGERRGSQHHGADRQRGEADPVRDVGVVEVEEAHRLESLCVDEVEHEEGRQHGDQDDKYMPGLKPASKLEGEITHSVEPLLCEEVVNRGFAQCRRAIGTSHDFLDARGARFLPSWKEPPRWRLRQLG